jgi:ABC-type branched-subunit amino acid transport system permease subunit
VILIGGVGSIHGAIFGSIFMVLVMEGLQWVVIPLSAYYPKLLFDFAYIKDGAFGLGYLRLSDLRTQRSGLPLVADQELFQSLAVFLLERR